VIARSLEWASAHPGLAAAVVAALVAAAAGAAWTVLRWARSLEKPAVAVAAAAAALCTAYSGDTAWRFAENRLDMVDTAERAVLFAAGEVALLAAALMARQNVQQTTTDDRAGTPGVPGVLVWVITGVQLVPAFAEGGLLGGIIRGFFGPILAAVLWHLAMGLEIRHVRPGALSGSLLATIGRELRERALSRLGLATRGRDAARISRDRATVRAVRLAALLADLDPGSRRGRRTARRLAAAVARADVGADAGQRRRLMELLAARRTAHTLATIEVTAPWQTTGPVLALPPAAAEPGVPAAAPAAVPAVPGAGYGWQDAVPAGARLLPIVARPADRPEGADEGEQGPAPGVDEYVPDPDEYAPEYVPDATPEEWHGDPDPLADQARTEWRSLLDSGGAPSVRQLRTTYGIGQARAQRIRDVLKGVPA
jgi:hypothetical protein